MKMKLQKGFTLIELLVVIAIIGILSSVVLASLNTARDKGADAAIKSNINNLRAQAEMIYDSKGDYNLVWSDATMNKGVSNADSANGGSKAVSKSAASTTFWAASAELKTSTEWYCVDSSGFAGTTTSAAASGTAIDTNGCA